MNSPSLLSTAQEQPNSLPSSCSSASSTTTTSTRTPPKPTTRLSQLQARQQSLQSTISALKAERNALVLSTLSASASAPKPASPTSHEKDEEEEKEEKAEDGNDTIPPDQISLALSLSNQKIKQHIRTLQQYNEIKDIGTQLMGMIAEKRGVRVVEVQKGFGVDCDD